MNLPYHLVLAVSAGPNTQELALLNDEHMLNNINTLGELVSKTGLCAYHAQMSGGGVVSINIDVHQHTQHNTKTSHRHITGHHNLPIQLRGGKLASIQCNLRGLFHSLSH